jgi:cation transport ATPase
VNVGAEGGLAAVTSVLVLLLIAAIFNRVHGQGVNVKGDRVIAGLLALPLITLWIQLVFPKASLWWALLAPLPLAVYVVLFSLTGVPPKPRFSWENLRNDAFTLALLISFGILYLVFGILYLV